MCSRYQDVAKEGWRLCSIPQELSLRCSIGSSTADNRPTVSPSLTSKPSFPFAIQGYDNDDCNEAEKLARAKRIEVIMKLSAKAVVKEAERKRAANIQPLSWAKPTFEYPSLTSNTQEKWQHLQRRERNPKTSRLQLQIFVLFSQDSLQRKRWMHL